MLFLGLLPANLSHEGDRCHKIPAQPDSFSHYLPFSVSDLNVQ